MATTHFVAQPHATHLPSPTSSASASTNQMSIYGHPSPTNSTTTTPANNSPTSPQLTNVVLNNGPLPLQTRQLRPPKAPLYVPAALRLPEHPQKQSPPTPPRSVHGSLDSLNETETIVEPLSHRSTMESTGSTAVSKMAEEELLKSEQLGKVMGLPTRDHWKADAQSPSCDSPTCRSTFGIFVRRHHCRHCGHVFCSSHTPHLVPLNQDAQFHPDGVLSRACDLCWRAYQRWLEVRNSRLSQIQSEIDTQQAGDHNLDDNHTDSGESDTSGEHSVVRPVLPTLPTQSSDIAVSVPRDWNWSTF